MAVMPPLYLDAVIALGVRHGTDQIHWAASGFLYGYYSHTREDGQKQYWVYVVTNRHVLKDQGSLCLRFNPSAEEPARTYDVDLTDSDGKPIWATSKREDGDVAVVSINPAVLKDDGIRFRFFTNDGDAARIGTMRDLQLSEGDGVFVLGFPMGLVGEERNYVIARSGSIARIRDMLAGSGYSFLIDANVFPGNSGGPVVLKPDLDFIEGTKANLQAYLLGVISAYIPYRDEAISRQTGLTMLAFTENSGLAVVQPMDLVDEAIEEHRKALASQKASGTATEPRVLPEG
jgi:hypothetical protein